MRLIIGCDVINRWSLCVTGVTCHCVCVKERVTLTTICNVVYLFNSRLFLCCTYCVFHNIIVSCIMTVTCMFNRVVFVLTNKSTCVIRSVVRRTDSCRYRQEDPSPYPSWLVTAGVGSEIVNRDQRKKTTLSLSSA